MAISAISLASGSSGNALIIRCGPQALLVDCGLAQRTLERHLAHAGLAPSQIAAVLLTHEHGDHLGCAAPFARRHGIPIALNGATARAIEADLSGVRLIDLPTGGESAIGCFGVTSFPISHDAAEPVGFVVQTDGATVGVATDLGCWDGRVASALAAADLIVLEANHDRERLWSAPYAAPIKQRIASERGHLDNMEAGRLLARIGADGRRRTAWLAHLSQEANSPEVAVRVVRGVLSMAQVGCIDVRALPRRAAVAWASDERGEQLSFF